jgi:hypothetical protein
MQWICCRGTSKSCTVAFSLNHSGKDYFLSGLEIVEKRKVYCSDRSKPQLLNTVPNLMGGADHGYFVRSQEHR